MAAEDLGSLATRRKKEKKEKNQEKRKNQSQENKNKKTYPSYDDLKTKKEKKKNSCAIDIEGWGGARRMKKLLRPPSFGRRATRELGVGEARCGQAGRRRRVGSGRSGVGRRAVGRGRVPSWWAGIGP